VCEYSSAILFGVQGCEDLVSIEARSVLEGTESRTNQEQSQVIHTLSGYSAFLFCNAAETAGSFYIHFSELG